MALSGHRGGRSATNSTSETLAATPKAVKTAYDNAEKRLQKDQNGADIPGKDTFTKNIGAWPELMNLLVKVTHIFRLIQVCQQTVPILHHQIFLLALWLFSTVMRHRGISLKIIGVKRFMTWLPATRYLFLNSAHYRKMSPGYPRKGSFRSGTAQLG
ncbi:phage tail fiber repeat protein [Escherichia coli MS 78-1]|nr:phage tail fiber repeat protein [Escherichia coli MS 78-1]